MRTYFIHIDNRRILRIDSLFRQSHLRNHISCTVDDDFFILMQTQSSINRHRTKRYIRYNCLIYFTRFHFQHRSCFTSSSYGQIDPFDFRKCFGSVYFECHGMLHNIIKFTTIRRRSPQNNSIGTIFIFILRILQKYS